ncbi:MAG: glycine betaine ABC transporter substrate-binding protein [Bacilli bacterium]
MLQDMWDLFLERQDFFVNLLVEHIIISLIAIIIAIVFGGIIGILISEYRHSVKPTLSAINFFNTIPAISMLGFLIPFSGVGNTTAIIALTIYALLPMVRNTYTGIANINPIIIESANGMGSTRLQVLWKIKIPLAMPVIMSGIRSMVTMTIALAGIASFIGAGGLGVAIYRGITTNNSTMTMVGSLLIAVLALSMDFLLGFVERKVNSNRVVKTRNKMWIAVGGLIICLTLIIGNVFNGQGKNTIKFATKPMTEQYILGEMLKLMIEAETDLEVELTHGVGGGTANIQPGMESGEFDIYPEYTGTGWNAVLKYDSLYIEELFDDMNDEYFDKYDMQWVGKYGFNNTYGLAVRSEIADEYNLKTYSDLRNIAGELVFGAEYDFFEREDGYDALTSTYGLEFKETMDLDIGLKYEAINQKQIDIMVIFTTDGQLSASDVVVLEDDRGFYPSYLCANVVRNEILNEYPELIAVFDKLKGSISDAEMSEMNNDVESNGKNPEEVAKEFLIKKNLLKE